MHVPQQIWKKNKESGEATQPDPAIEEDAPLRGQQKADDDAEAKDGDGVLLFHPEAGDDAEPEPVAGVVAFYREDGEVGAAHPEIGFEAVGAEQATVGEVLWRDDDGECAQEQGEAASAEFPGQNSGLHDEKRRSQRGNEANAAEGISKDGATDVDEKGD